MQTPVYGLNDRYFLSVDQTCDLVGLSRTTLWRKESTGELPKNVGFITYEKGI